MSYSGTTGKPVFPYFSGTQDIYHPEPINVPVSGTYANNNGMQ